MSGQPQLAEADDNALHAGMKGAKVRTLQQKLRALGYPCGAVDGVFGEQTFRAVTLFQQDHDLGGDAGVWLPDYEKTLDNAAPMLPKRKAATHRDLESAGDEPVKQMNLLQRIFAWLFGASAVAQAFEGESVLDSVNGIRSLIEPVQGVFDWASGNRWLIAALGCVAVIALIRAIRARHVEAYQNFNYQGPASTNNEAHTQEAHQ